MRISITIGILRNDTSPDTKGRTSRACASTSPTSACSATSPKPAASPAARSARILRWRRPRPAHPNVSVDLEERLSDEIVGLIAEGVGDLGIVAATVDVSALETYPFRRDRFVLVVARDHPLAKRSKIGFAQVLDHDFVGLDRASALQRFLAEKAARIGRPLRLRVQLRSFDAVCRLVECKVGIGIVPETTVHRVARTMAITAVALADP